MKKIWLMSAEEYAYNLGVEKPYPSFMSNVSVKQLNKIPNTEIVKKQEMRKKYNKAVKEWEEKVWEAYKKGEFRLRDVAHVNDIDILLLLKIRDFLKEPVLSPFNVYKMEYEEGIEKRNSYFNQLDEKVWNKAKKQEIVFEI